MREKTILMKIKSIEFKNFASYGNQIQKIDFDDKGYLFLTVGANGYGKTTISNVIKFLLYGKVDGVNLSDLPNRINKNLWGRIRMVCKKKLIEIERGVSPNIFKIKIDNKEYDQAGKLNSQDYIEKEFFEIPYHVFRNIIILSINDFKSFLTMSPGDKKNIVDKLFGFSVINDMREIVKKDKKGILEEIKTYEDELNILADSIVSINSKLNELEKLMKAKDVAKIRKFKKDLRELNENKIKLQEARDRVKKNMSEVEKRIQEHSSLYNIKDNNFKKAKNDLKLYKNKQCPLCESHLDTDFQKERKQHFEDQIRLFPDELDIIRIEIDELRKRYRDAQSKQHQIISRVSSLETNMKNFKVELVKIAEGTDKGEEMKQLHALIKEDRVREEERTKKRIVKGDKSYYLDILENLLGDEGIKNLAMKTILPALNTNIAAMTKQIHLPFMLKFDDRFNCNITSLGEEINPKTLSTGERKKADFVIIIAMIKLLKLRFPSLNILFLDEIFSSVDFEGIYNILDILHKTIQEINLNTFVINHTVLPSELFDKKIEIVKRNGFSEFTIEDLD